MKFIAAVYEHAAKLIDMRPWEVSRDPALLFRAHARAFERYCHDPVVPGIDIYNVEAECYGSSVSDPGGIGVPSIEHHLCQGVADLCLLAPLDPGRGRFHGVLGVGLRLQQEMPDAHVAIPLAGPFSLASHLVGFEELLTGVIMEQETLRLGLERIVTNQLQLCEVIAASGLDVMFFDSAAGPPLLSPGAFAQLARPVLQKLIQGAKTISARSISLIIGGNTSTVVEDLMAIGADHILCPAETEQARFMDIARVFPDPVIRINMNPVVFSAGDPGPALAEAARVVALAKGRERVCIGSGVLPYDAVPEIVCRVRDFVEEQRA